MALFQIGITFFFNSDIDLKLWDLIDEGKRDFFHFMNFFIGAHGGATGR